MSSQTPTIPGSDSHNDKLDTSNRQRRSSSATRRGSLSHVNSPTIPNAVPADGNDNSSRFVTGQGSADKGRHLRPLAGPVMSMLTGAKAGSSNSAKNSNGTSSSGGNSSGLGGTKPKSDGDKDEAKKKEPHPQKEYWDKEVYSNAASGQ